jgi:MFS family permease
MFENRDFRRLALGSSLNSAGFQGEQVVASLLLYQLTGSTFWVGVGLAFSFLPMLLVGVAAGASADHFDRRKLLPRCEAVQVVAMILVAAMFWTGTVTLTILLVFLFVTGTVRAMHQPVKLSYAYDVLGADQLVGALGALSVVSRFGQLIGAVGAGIVLEHWGAGPAYGLLAIFHFAAMLALARLQQRGGPVSPDAVPQSLRQNLTEYAHELRTNPLLLRLALLASVAEIFGFSFVTALPELATSTLNTDAQGLGLLHGARSIGGLIAGFLLMRAGRLKRNGHAYLAVMIGFGIGLVLLALSGNLWLAMFATALIAFCAASTDVLVQTMMQLCVSDRLRGRAMGAWVLALGAGPIGHLELGLIIGWAGAATGLALNGGIMIVCGVVIIATMPRLRNL